MNLISSIYNYCDRWCEHCEFTQACAIYVQELERGTLEPDGLILMGQSIERVSEYLKEVSTLINDLKEKLEAYELETEDNEFELSDDLMYFNLNPFQELIDQTLEFFQNLDTWFLNQVDNMDRIRVQLLSSGTLEEFHAFDYACELIQRYGFLVAVKTERALFNYTNKELVDPIQNDENGSAKTALIAVDKIKKELVYLMSYLVDEEDVILDALAFLSSYSKQLSQIFPQWNEFKRPGFDDN